MDLVTYGEADDYDASVKKPFAEMQMADKKYITDADEFADVFQGCLLRNLFHAIR